MRNLLMYLTLVWRRLLFYRVIPLVVEIDDQQPSDSLNLAADGNQPRPSEFKDLLYSLVPLTDGAF